MKLFALPGELTVWKIKPGDQPPSPPRNEKCFWSMTLTGEEISIVSSPENVPRGVQEQPGWKALAVEGPLDFSMVGVLSSLASPLAESGIPLFVISTFNTDYLLVSSENLEKTITVLEKAGHQIDTKKGISE